MREIKFRGKTVSTKEWVCGDLVHNAFNGHRIFPVGIQIPGCYPDEVIAETVGQFIGLHDKNGKEIYEGDIVKFEDVSGYKDGCASVIWHEDSCGYYLENDDDNIYDTLYDFTPSYQMEIIGNIHENPELLEATC